MNWELEHVLDNLGSEVREMDRDLEQARDELTELREQNDNLIHQIERLTMGQGSLQGQLEQARAYSIERITELKAGFESEREAIVQELGNYVDSDDTDEDFELGYSHGIKHAIEIIIRSFSSEGEK